MLEENIITIYNEVDPTTEASPAIYAQCMATLNGMVPEPVFTIGLSGCLERIGDWDDWLGGMVDLSRIYRTYIFKLYQPCYGENGAVWYFHDSAFDHADAYVEVYMQGEDEESVVTYGLFDAKRMVYIPTPEELGEEPEEDTDGA